MWQWLGTVGYIYCIDKTGFIARDFPCLVPSKAVDVVRVDPGPSDIYGGRRNQTSDFGANIDKNKLFNYTC